MYTIIICITKHFILNCPSRNIKHKVDNDKMKCCPPYVIFFCINFIYNTDGVQNKDQFLMAICTRPGVI